MTEILIQVLLTNKKEEENSFGRKEEEREKSTLKHSDTGAAVTESLINGS